MSLTGALRRPQVIREGAGGFNFPYVRCEVQMRTPNSLPAAAMTCLLWAVLACEESAGPERTPAEIIIVSGVQQTSVVGRESKLTVKVVDSAGRPVRRTAVQWQITTGSGSVVTNVSETDSKGLAHNVWTLGLVPGTQSVAVKVGGLPHVTFTTVAMAGEADSIDISANMQYGLAETWLPSPLVARARDAYNNPVIGVSAEWTVTAGGGRVESVASETDSAGRASAMWMLGATSAPQTVQLTIGGTRKVVFTASVPPAMLRVVDDSVVIAAGDTARARTLLMDSAGTALSGTLVWKSIHPGIVDAAGGLLRAKSRGRALVQVRHEPDFGLTDSMRVDVLGIIRGRVTDISGASPRVEGVIARVSSDDWRDSTQLNADGTFRLRVPPWRDTLEVLIVDTAAAPAYLPVLAYKPLEALQEDTIYFLVPTIWNITAGQFAGSKVPISLNTVMTPGLHGHPPVYTSYPHQSGIAAYWKRWAPEIRPVPLILWQSQSSTPITPSDSTNLWNTIRSIESRFGVTLFQPAGEESITDGSRDVTIVLNTGMAPLAVSAGLSAGFGLPEAVLGWRGGQAIESREVNLTMQWATTIVKSPVFFSDEAFWSRAVLFYLGMRAGCVYPSANARCPEFTTRTITVHDVAYWQVHDAIRAAHVVRSTTNPYHPCCARFGAITSLFGERAIWLGLEPVPMAEPIQPDAIGAILLPGVPADNGDAAFCTIVVVEDEPTRSYLHLPRRASLADFGRASGLTTCQSKWPPGGDG